MKRQCPLQKHVTHRDGQVAMEIEISQNMKGKAVCLVTCHGSLITLALQHVTCLPALNITHFRTAE